MIRSYVSSLLSYPYHRTRYNAFLEVFLCLTILSVTYSKLLSTMEVCGIVREGFVVFNEVWLPSNEIFLLPQGVSFEPGGSSLEVIELVCAGSGRTVSVWRFSCRRK